MAQGWHVTGVEGHEQYNGRDWERGSTVEIMTDKGSKHSFFFPDAKFNQPNVDATIQEWVDRHDTIWALGNSE
jgi:hypothetical protein